jgi:hypothetical protein
MASGARKNATLVSENKNRCLACHVDAAHRFAAPKRPPPQPSPASGGGSQKQGKLRSGAAAGVWPVIADPGLAQARPGLAQARTRERRRVAERTSGADERSERTRAHDPRGGRFWPPPLLAGEGWGGGDCEARSAKMVSGALNLADLPFPLPSRGSRGGEVLRCGCAGTPGDRDASAGQSPLNRAPGSIRSRSWRGRCCPPPAHLRWRRCRFVRSRTRRSGCGRNSRPLRSGARPPAARAARGGHRHWK